MTPKSSESRIWLIPSLDNLELLRAKHSRQAFPKHSHERYAVGVIEQGALGFYYRGENVVAAPGQISLCIPGEAHTGQPAAAEGWTYRMFYIDVKMLERALSDISARPSGLPFFSSGVLDDPVLARNLYALHVHFETTDLPLLEQESLLLAMLTQLIKRHADAAPLLTSVGRETDLTATIKHYLEAHYAEDVSLETLSRLTGRNRYHLVRSFHKSAGLPPHAYLRQVRVRRAKALLALGHPPAEVAVATGFTDQSHLTRWFKRFWGFTPGHYRNSVQDSAS